jgi:hypothetical protein
MNGSAHKTIGAMTSVATLAIDNRHDKQSAIHNPVIATPLAAFGGTLPDFIFELCSIQVIG